MKKPTATSIAAAVPLSKGPARPADPITACNVCGQPSDSLYVWREHDELDQPLTGHEALVFVGNDHKACIKTMEAHPRLYAERRGDPGHFPLLCGPCTFRSGFGCTHPDLRANGGPGLSVQLSNMFKGAIFCGGRRGGGLGRIPIVNRAMSCAGQKVAGEP